MRPEGLGKLIKNRGIYIWYNYVFLICKKFPEAKF
jgi:hypothetical protein